MTLLSTKIPKFGHFFYLKTRNQTWHNFLPQNQNFEFKNPKFRQQMTFKKKKIAPTLMNN